jgi:site-specific recombinase XerD
VQGRPIHSSRNAFESAARAAGIEDFTFHDLRQPFASRLVMAGVDLPTVKELLGHKDISMTLGYSYLPTGIGKRRWRSWTKVPTVFTTRATALRRRFA